MRPKAAAKTFLGMALIVSTFLSTSAHGSETTSCWGPFLERPEGSHEVCR